MTGGEYVTMLVIRHPRGISEEGAIKQRLDADHAVAAIGLDVVAASTTFGNAAGTGIGLILGDPE